MFAHGDEQGSTVSSPDFMSWILSWRAVWFMGLTGAKCHPKENWSKWEESGHKLESQQEYEYVHKWKISGFNFNKCQFHANKIKLSLKNKSTHSISLDVSAFTLDCNVYNEWTNWQSEVHTGTIWLNPNQEMTIFIDSYILFSTKKIPFVYPIIGKIQHIRYFIEKTYCNLPNLTVNIQTFTANQHCSLNFVPNHQNIEQPTWLPSKHVNSLHNHELVIGFPGVSTIHLYSIVTRSQFSNLHSFLIFLGRNNK